jgi:hypothetical protein
MADLTRLDAQSPRTTRANSGIWLQAFGDYHVAPRWAILTEAQIRRANFASEANQTLGRLGVNFDVTRSGSVRLGAGYLFAQSHPYGAFPAPNSFPEHRVWQQLILNARLGQTALQQRFRLEQRWVGQVATAPSGDAFVDHWVYRGRARAQFRATIPLRGRPVQSGDLYVAVADEVFVSFGENVGTNLFDQNRAYAVLGLQLRRGLRIEGGYLNVTAAKANGSNLEVNHILLVSLYHTADLFGP